MKIMVLALIAFPLVACEPLPPRDPNTRVFVTTDPTMPPEVYNDYGAKKDGGAKDGGDSGLPPAVKH